MSVRPTVLRTRLARRILILFFVCALLPVGTLAVYSYLHVTRQLHDESQARLRQATKSTAMTLLERLQLSAAELQRLAANLRRRSSAPRDVTGGSATLLSERFAALALVSRSGRATALLGQLGERPALGVADEAHLRSGKPILSVGGPAAGEARIRLAQALDPRDLSHGVLWAELPPGDLWRTGELPPATELCVFDEANAPLFCSLPVAMSVLERLAPALTGVPTGSFAWEDPDGAEYVAGYWSMPLKYEYGVARWTVVLSESEGRVLAPLASFRRTFPLVILLALWVVLLLSNVQVRRSLDPLTKLQEGTRRIAQRDFGTPVQVASGDEFEDLAGSFNAMAQRLARQFQALSARTEIDRAVLSALDTERIVETVLSRAPAVLGCEGVIVGLDGGDAADEAWHVVGLLTSDGEKVTCEIRPAPEELQELREHPDYLVDHAGGVLRSYLRPFTARGLRSFLVLPVFLQQKLTGMIAVGYTERSAPGEEDLGQARQLADQVAVALSNARLLEEVQALSWGTLAALARTIDAKSPWTADHSERVTSLALAIGRRLGLTREQVDNLHRGGLLHDIGKIGIAADILDKPGRLTEEEVLAMREHVNLGARILAPITAYAGAIQVVRWHHERFDGSGYPDGLAGERIPLLARIFAVADCFDAITSERPYRSGLPRPDAIQYIRAHAGAHFDPEVVRAFLAVMADEAAPVLSLEERG